MQFNHLIKAARDREPTAQRSIVDQYSPYLYVIAKRYANDASQAKDILQDSLVLIINNIHQFSGKESDFKAWMKRICINTALGKKRKLSHKNESYPGELIHDKTIAPQVLQELNMKDIIALLQYLPSLQRQIFNLSIIDGFKHAEIARILEVKESTSRTLLTRARKKLQLLIIEQDKIRIR